LIFCRNRSDVVSGATKASGGTISVREGGETRRDEARLSKFGGPILEKIQQRLALIFNIKPQYETSSGKHAGKIGQLQLC
jgi:hypothetical protein